MQNGHKKPGALILGNLGPTNGKLNLCLACFCRFINKEFSGTILFILIPEYDQSNKPALPRLALQVKVFQFFSTLECVPSPFPAIFESNVTKISGCRHLVPTKENSSKILNK